jgi:hypothetical protein
MRLTVQLRTIATLVAFVVAWGTTSTPASAQQPRDSIARRQQRQLDSLAESIKALHARLDSLAAVPPTEAATPASAAPARGSGMYMNLGFDALSDFGWSTTPDVVSIQRGDHDPKVRGFTIPNVELTFDGAVDPYFKGFSALVYKLGPDGETGVEVEEAWAQTTSLPHNLQAKAGQFLTDFGRQNAQHPHAWAFVDQPLVLNQMFGPDGLRGQGAKLAWLLPSDFYVEAMLTVINSFGGTTSSFRSDESNEIHGGVPVDRPVNGLSDLLVVPRLTASLDLTETQTVVVGASAGFGPNNSGRDARTRIYGVDAYYKWKAVSGQAGFPFVSWQTELLSRRYDAASRVSFTAPGLTLPAETLSDWGGYSQLLWGIRPRIIAGIRGDVTRNGAAAFTTDLRENRDRISPNLTWYPSEFSKLRLQYNYDHRATQGDDHSLWLQFEFMLGAHAAHKF